MRVLVTGGAGYVGSHTVVELLAHNHTVCIVDNLVNASPKVLNYVEEISGRTFDFHQVDILDTAILSDVFAEFRPHAVLHFAGLKSVSESLSQPLNYFEVNVGGTISLLKVMEQFSCHRFVFSSSATVYGIPRYIPIDESHPCEPLSVYGRTKFFAEGLLGDWQRASTERSVTILRYFNPVGAHPSGKIGEDPVGLPNNLMPYLSQVASGRLERLRVFGSDYDTSDGTGVRDYLHVVDLARAHIAALEHVQDAGLIDVFNIGTGQGYSVLEMVDAFRNASGQQIQFELAPRRDGDVAEAVSSPAQARRVLGWHAVHDLTDMCESAWRWQSQNPDGFA